LPAISQRVSLQPRQPHVANRTTHQPVSENPEQHMVSICVSIHYSEFDGMTNDAA